MFNKDQSDFILNSAYKQGRDDTLAAVLEYLRRQHINEYEFSANAMADMIEEHFKGEK
jgi:hypothetical protein